MPTFEIMMVSHIYPDKLPTKLLKLLSTEISPCLTLLFAVIADSLHQGTVVLVTPLFKKSERSKPENYHPISLNCVCSKILEHIIHTKI